MTLKEKILQLHNDGKSYREIKTELKCSLSTISYYCNDKSRIKSNNRLTCLRKRNKKHVWEIKEKMGCCQCGNKDPRCLDFHHINPKTKHSEIGRLIHSGTSISNIQKELEKCTVLCANCHRELHFKNSYNTKIRKYIRSFKTNTECKQCGHKGIASIEFHHVNSKNLVLSQVCNKHTLEEIMLEIEKCVILCTNCHRKLHHE